MNQDVKEGLDITDQTAESFKKISEMTTQISGALQHMNGTLEKLAAGSQNVTNAVEDITSVAKEGSAGIHANNFTISTKRKGHDYQEE